MIINGMLWFDNDTRRPFDTKIEQAIQHFKTKYGDAPNIVYVHPSCMPSAEAAQAIKVEAAENVLPFHYLLGIRQAKDGAMPA
jgi:L-ascorbate metabolism protein UlaG (beta-lactamase superfamily)